MKLSIITINYNNASDLARTIESVVNQTWKNFEYIVIDGGSTDGSVEVIQANESNLTYWVSEPDRGVFNAMNKGIKEAKGEYLLMLNAGDLLCDNKALERVFGSELYHEDILAGNVYRAVNGKVFQESYFPDELSFNFFRNGSLSHQGTFIKRELHNLVGMYIEDLKYSSDWLFMVITICKYNASYKHLPFFVATCDCGGLTCRSENFPAMKQERDEVLLKHFPAFVTDYANFDLIESRKLKKRLAGNLLKYKKIIKENIKTYFFV